MDADNFINNMQSNFNIISDEEKAKLDLDFKKRRKGRSMCTEGRGGSELFCVISSMNANTSASPSVGGCAPCPGGGAPGASGGARLSRSSRNWRAS